MRRLLDQQITRCRALKDLGDVMRYAEAQLGAVRTVAEHTAGFRHFSPFAYSWQVRIERKLRKRRCVAYEEGVGHYRQGRAPAARIAANAAG